MVGKTTGRWYPGLYLEGIDAPASTSLKGETIKPRHCIPSIIFDLTTKSQELSSSLFVSLARIMAVWSADPASILSSEKRQISWTHVIGRLA